MRLGLAVSFSFIFFEIHSQGYHGRVPPTNDPLLSVKSSTLLNPNQDLPSTPLKTFTRPYNGVSCWRKAIRLRAEAVSREHGLLSLYTDFV